MQSEADEEPESERERVPESGEAEQAAAKTLVLDLEPGEQEQEGKAEQAQHLDRRVDRDPAQHLRANRDSEHDLQHDGRQAHLRREPERERCSERNSGDDCDPVERDVAHWASCSAKARALRWD